jgi:hypothetical protein
MKDKIKVDGKRFVYFVAAIHPLLIRGRAMSIGIVANRGVNLIVALTFLKLTQVLGSLPKGAASKKLEAHRERGIIHGNWEIWQRWHIYRVRAFYKASYLNYARNRMFPV